ncbi:MAG: 3-beta hydroxysteroid dehydrogenase [Deltaproteobacteria bacterium RBG_13_53_10]|nr:MAG: 3-beta hydroxysteroid dehydrogenase [Deltaproteobacteria bacterium RBG_13_53_10]
MDRVKGKVAIITGGAGGMGRAHAMLLAKEGAKVVVTDTQEVQGKKVAEEIRSQGGEAVFIKHDVSSETEWKRVIAETVERFGKLDILVNNAGVMLWKKIEDTSLEEWRWLMSVNLEGVFLGTKHAMEAMKKSGGGSIINISSTAGIVGTLDTSAYHASKGGVRIFTKAAALECSKAGYDYNIRVNSIHPGVIKTPLVAELFKDEDKMRTALSWHPIGHFGEPEDIAYGVLYLASDESKFVTGAELVIDGGWTAH